MNPTIRTHGNVSILDLPARVVIGDGDVEMGLAIRKLADEGHKQIIVNMEKMNVMDSTGLGQLIAAHVHASRQGAIIKVVKPNKKKLDGFTIAKFHMVFDVFEDENEALTSF